MIDDEQLGSLLRDALPPVPDGPPSRDLWQRVRQHGQRSASWPWLDLGIGAAVVAALAFFPRWIPILLFHL